jgi:malate dehydrogenase
MWFIPTLDNSFMINSHVFLRLIVMQAYAGQFFASRLMAAMSGEKDVVECAFVENDLTSAPFFATKVKLGPNGAEEVLPYGPLSAFEQEGLDSLVPDLIVQAKKGIEFANK